MFLDRDNTLIHDPGYIHDPDQVALIEGVPQALARLRAMGFLLVLTTNQSAVARGIVTEQGLDLIHQRLQQLLEGSALGGRLDAIYYCPYHPQGQAGPYCRESLLRKPAPGMLLAAARDLDIDLSRSWCIGDKGSDIKAGSAAGCRTILIRGGCAGPSGSQLGQDHPVEPDYVAASLLEAAMFIERISSGADEAWSFKEAGHGRHAAV